MATKLKKSVQKNSFFLNGPAWPLVEDFFLRLPLNGSARFIQILSSFQKSNPLLDFFNILLE